MLGGSLGLVEAGQPSVVPLIQPPALLHGEVGLPNLRQDGPEYSLKWTFAKFKV